MYFYILENNFIWSTDKNEYIDHKDVADFNSLSLLPTVQELDKKLKELKFDSPIVDPLAIKQECQRRIVLLMKARDLDDCFVKQLNANAQANRLNHVRHDRDWTSEEKEQVNYLENMLTQIERLRKISNELEQTLPIDYKNDNYWK